MEEKKLLDKLTKREYPEKISCDCNTDYISYDSNEGDFYCTKCGKKVEIGFKEVI